MARIYQPPHSSIKLSAFFESDVGSHFVFAQLPLDCQHNELCVVSSNEPAAEPREDDPDFILTPGD